MIFRSKFCTVIKVFVSVIVCSGSDELYSAQKPLWLVDSDTNLSMFCLHWAHSLPSCLLGERCHECTILNPWGLRTRFQKWEEFPMQGKEQEQNSMVIWQVCPHNLCLCSSFLQWDSSSSVIEMTVLQMTLLVYIPGLSMHNFRLWQCYHACF